MQSKKTHEQQLRIIEKQVDTSNAAADFDPTPDLKRSDAAKAALRDGSAIRTGMQDLTEDRGMIRGRNQESVHHKGSNSSEQ